MGGPVVVEPVPVSVPQQRLVDGRHFPLIVAPPPPPSPPLDDLALCEWVKGRRDWLEGLLSEHGAVVLRGFPFNSAKTFNDFVDALGWEEFPYVGGAAPRTNVVGRVFTSNEAPPDQLIPFHHEMAQVPEFPGKLLFYCDVAPEKGGGETPLLLSRELVRRLEQEVPEFVKNLREKGLIYTRVLPKEDDPASPIGRGWVSTFHTTDKEEAEMRAQNLGVHLEWLPDGTVKTVTSILPAIRRFPGASSDVWFNSMVAAYTGWIDIRNEPGKAVTFGDGHALPKEAMRKVGDVMEEIAVAVPYNKGDVIVLDNHTVQHARRSFVPPRRILAALCK